MPGMDGTGPMGMGPMTGGGRGWCNPYTAGWRTPMGYPYSPLRMGWGGIPYGTGMMPMNPYFGGFRPFPYRPFGRGRGLRRWWW
jgi:hypothetical protein